MSKIVVTVKVTVEPSNRDAFRDAAIENADGANKDEPGCQLFSVAQSKDDENVFFIYEIYDDEAALKAHQDAPHYKSALAKIRALNPQSDVTVCSLVA
jgi:quinol monooxygenase YgiN